jgi:hypothetical protein
MTMGISGRFIRLDIHLLIMVWFCCYQLVGKVVFPRLVKNIQMQGTRNPEE